MSKTLTVSACFNKIAMLLWFMWAHNADGFKIILCCKSFENYCASGMNLLIALELAIPIEQIILWFWVYFSLYPSIHNDNDKNELKKGRCRHVI